MEELVQVEDPRAMFLGGSVGSVLADVRALVGPMVFDMSTAKGRKECASVAARVARSKTLLDGVGKDLVSDWKAKAKAVDGQRKLLRDGLDVIKAEVRAPLTAYESAEAKKVQMRRDQIEHVRLLGSPTNPNGFTYSSTEIKNRLALLRDMPAPDEWFGDLIENACAAYQFAADSLGAALVLRRDEEAKAEAERLELVKAEEVAREKAIADAAGHRVREAEEAAAAAARKAAEEAARAEDAERQRVETEANAERRAKEAAARAKQEAEEAARREREAREEAERLEREKAERKAADMDHRARINTEVVKALMYIHDITEDQAMAVVVAIATGKVPHVVIRY